MAIANRVGAGFGTVMLACGIILPAKADVMTELVPTGKLRVAIAVAPAPSALYAVKDSTTGEYRGVTVELGSAMAKKLGVQVEFLPHLASGEIQNSAASGNGISPLCRLTKNARNSSTSAMLIICCKAHTWWHPARSSQKSRTQTRREYA